MIKKLFKLVTTILLLSTILLAFSSCFDEPTNSNDSNSDKSIRLTFKEGWGVSKIVGKFVENGIGTKEEFLDVIENGDFSDFWFVNELEQAEDDYGRTRYYRLEGYLFADTYYFDINATPEECIRKMLSNFDSKFDETFRQRCEEIGYTCDQIITLASIVQWEAYKPDFALVSSAIHNRIENPGYETRGLIQSDATGNYDETYSTYKYKGLPPGPVCSPSYDAIYYALYPEESDYYYFVSDRLGNMYYSKTYEEHHEKVVEIYG